MTIKKRNIALAVAMVILTVIVMLVYVRYVYPKYVEPADDYARAEQLFENGDYVRAAMTLDSLGSYSKARLLAARAWKLAGDTEYNAGNLDKALSYYLRGNATEEDFQRVNAGYFQFATNAFKNGNYPLGESLLSCITNKEEYASQADVLRIDAANTVLLEGTDREKIDEATSLLSRCAENSAGSIAEMLIRLGEDLLKEYEVDAANSVFNMIPRLFPEATASRYTQRINNIWLATAQLAIADMRIDTARRCIELGGGNPNEYDLSGGATFEYAEQLFAAGKYIDALKILNVIQEANPAADALRERIMTMLRGMVSAGDSQSYAVRGLDGMVRLEGTGWEDNNITFRNISSISVGRGAFLVALREDGTVIAAGKDAFNRLNVSRWTNIVQVACGANHTLGLRSNGMVVATGIQGSTETSAWSDIVFIAAGYNTSYGVRSDGTVVAIGSNEYGQRNVMSWQSIKAVSAGYRHAVGLTESGTVVACGSNDSGQCSVAEWRNIVMVSAGAYHTVGLRADGTLIACGSNANGECDVSGLTNVAGVSCGEGYTLVVFMDGTYQLIGELTQRAD